MRGLAVTAVAAVLVLGVASAAAKGRQPLLATVWNGNVVSLTRVDPMSLRPAGGPSLVIGGGAYLVARSPRGATLAFDTERGVVLAFVDAATLKLRGTVNLGEGWTGAAAWPSPRRLVAILGSEGGARLAVVDPAARKLLVQRRLPLSNDLLASAATATRVVFLLSESPSIAPVRLAVAGVDGTIRSVLLSSILGGTESADEPAGKITTAWPALAVDPSGRRAAVVGAGGLVAEVNLDTLAVAYHPRMVRTPARAAKALDGWQRYATWLPSGTLAVTGTDYEAKLVDDKEEQTGTPSGLSLVDTADWTTTVVDAGASFVARAGDVLVAFGGGWVGAKTTGIGLHGYGADGSARFQLFAGEMIGEVQAAAGLVYVVGCSGRCFRIVDPHTGTLAGTAETPRTTQLVGGR